METDGNDMKHEDNSAGTKLAISIVLVVVGIVIILGLLLAFNFVRYLF